MIVKPTVAELLDKLDEGKNRYSLVIATAKRARQISMGVKPLTKKDDTSPVTLAADEIEEDKIKIYNQKEWDELEKENETEESKEEKIEEKIEE